MLVWVILTPLLGALINGLAFASGFWKKVIGGDEHTEKRIVSFVGCGVIFISAILSSILFLRLLELAPSDRQIVQELYLWIPSGDFSVSIEFLFDPLSCVMALVVTWISFLIHVYSIGYMHEDHSYSRYFTYLNIFVFFMLVLVLGNSFPLLFVGWEGVGLSSYLLIGFWYEDYEKAYAGRKAFILNRIGDFGFIIGIFLIFYAFGSTNFSDVFNKASDPAFISAIPAVLITVIALLLFLGAVGKSAQFPLYVWLPDAMAGPTPVSALIHAATMVTAGAYMMARCSVFYTQSPTTQMIVVSIAAFTALLAASIALTQNDIKKVLAYSTISQLGYMFMAIGVGAYAAGIFHLVTHAFFKALLFLGSGSVIHSLAGEQDIRKMGGLRGYIPLTSYTFLIGTLAIAGIPLLSGFYSKDGILGALIERGYIIHWFIALLTVCLTALYMIRLYLLTFEGSTRVPESMKGYIHESPNTMTVPLLVLALLSIFGGYIGVPDFMAKIVGVLHSNIFEDFLLPSVYIIDISSSVHHLMGHWSATLLSIIAAAIGVMIAVYLYIINPRSQEMFMRSNLVSTTYRFSYAKWFVDELYDIIFVKPFNSISNIAATFDLNIIDGAVNGISDVVIRTATILRSVQTGILRFYAAVMAIGALAIIVYIVIYAGR
ncbi:MAG: NADH-quinone oxidoreductase subunit L [Deltaproteobacteria bacterium]|nr:NADH-quinone oxidoreductase subunit L [Deltaproteobacteria bacterium]